MINDVWQRQDPFFHERQRVQQAQARAAERKRVQQRVDSYNRAAAEQRAKPWSEHQKFFEDYQRRQKEKLNREQQKKAQDNMQEFFERLNRYKGPMDPLLDLLKVKSKRPTLGEIKTAYISSIRRVHPDAGGSVEETQRVNIAYEILREHYARA